jgi:hypothetical protein
MRALITSLAAVGLAISSLSAMAAEPFSSQSGVEQRTSAEGDEFNLKSTGHWSRPGRTADEDTPLKSAGASSKPGREADEEKPLKSAGASSPRRTADEEQPLKSSGSSSKPGRTVEEIAPLRSSGGVNRPAARIDDDGNRM